MVACGEGHHLEQRGVMADGGVREVLPGEVILKDFVVLYEVSPRPHVNIRAFPPLLQHAPRYHLSFQGLDEFLISHLIQLEIQTPNSIILSEKDLEGSD